MAVWCRRCGNTVAGNSGVLQDQVPGFEVQVGGVYARSDATTIAAGNGRDVVVGDGAVGNPDNVAPTGLDVDATTCVACQVVDDGTAENGQAPALFIVDATAMFICGVAGNYGVLQHQGGTLVNKDAATVALGEGIVVQKGGSTATDGQSVNHNTGVAGNDKHPERAITIGQPGVRIDGAVAPYLDRFAIATIRSLNGQVLGDGEVLVL